MASATALFKKGVLSFQSNDYNTSVQAITQAIEASSRCDPSSSPPMHVMYDSRSSAYAKLGKTSLALADAKSAIDVAPDRWQGYARAARVFLQCGRLSEAGIMARMAKDRCDEKRRVDMEMLEGQVRDAAAKLGKMTASSAGGNRLKPSTKLRINPFHNLPIEVFEAICEHVLASSTICAAFQSSTDFVLAPTVSTNVLTLAHVCTRWRTIVENTPSLWRTLRLGPHKTVEKAKIWHRRSNGVLHELVLGPGILWHSTSSSLPTVLQSFCWDKLRALSLEQAYIEVDALHVWLAICSSLSLRVLSINDAVEGRASHQNRDLLLTVIPTAAETAEPLGNADLDDNGESKPNTKHALLSLHHLSLDCCLFSFMLDKVMLQKTQLRSLRLRNVFSNTPTPLLPLLAANPLLQHLAIDFSEKVSVIYDGQLPPQSPIILPSLLRLEWSGRSDILQLFKHVAVPNIQTLKVRRALDVIPLHIISRQIQQARTEDSGVTGLRSLVLNSCVFDTADLLSLLGCCPNLETLEVTHFGEDLDHVVEALRHLCPCIQYLDFSFSIMLGTGPLVRLVQSRLPKFVLRDQAKGHDETTQSPSTISVDAPRRTTNQLYTSSPCSSTMVGPSSFTASSSPSQTAEPTIRIQRLKIDGCPRIEASALPWLRVNVPELSCVYAPKKVAAAEGKRARGRI